ncbi:MAG: pilus assembly protein PilM [Polyangiaceae bacterium]|nr:pilus assembly protein PilM [Polyangiaceae bacterium]
MSRLVGIDVRATHVRTVVLRTSYRHVTVERMLEVDRQGMATLEQALQVCGLPALQHADSLAIAVDGQQTYVRRIELPAAAAKRLDEIVPFEVEAQVPVDLGELLYDHRVLRQRGEDNSLKVLVAAARTEHISAQLTLAKAALGREPERIGCGALPLANLASVLPALAAAEEPIALVDLGATSSDVVILSQGEPVHARTLSEGVAGLPGTAAVLAARLRQTFAAHGAEPVTKAYLLGAGADAQGAEAYLAYELGIAVEKLPALLVDGLSPADTALLPRFGKALGLALSLGSRPLDLDLRQGPLSYQRGFGFLKEKAPVLSGLAAAILVSFLFSTWAQTRSLEREGEVLKASLETVSKEVLGQSASDGSEAQLLLERKLQGHEADPMPHVDAFDVMVELSKAVPVEVKHDVEELDVQRGHVRLTGIVGTTAEAQQIATKLGEYPCFADVKISKVTQVVNADQQKYVVEFDLRCPQDAGSKKRGKGEKNP